ncbi:LysR family transcriptional regulator [Alteromonas sp. a30]|uniref:LysR family transcriptional regulator n=1 Tax=Alteromonas sp. a30 TaxID=2730917 RepID=UPI0022823F7B|nr:LysR family transcriptional regulator [Alteromonas sp. a30]MCY7296443.1 LysR family transcriptional regulator [Alteromonas sp. a30]
MHKLSLLHLEIVHSIVNQGSMTNAAQTLCLSQPALSHQLKDLESRLGCRVFHRVNKKLILTKVGIEVYNAAETILGQISQLSAKVKRLSENNDLHIRISTECYTCYHWLPEVIQKLKMNKSNIDVELVIEATADPVQALIQGQIDLAIITQQPLPSPVTSRPLVEDELVVVVSEAHALAHLSHFSLNDLAKETLFIYDIPDSRNFVLSHVLQGDETKVAKLQKVQLTEAILNLVNANLGVTIMADWAVPPFLQEKHLKRIPLLGISGRREWVLASLSDISEHEQYFVDALTDILNQRLEDNN